MKTIDTKRHKNWKGGRTITSHGYVRINVGVGHHLADCKGYAYEHRLVAEEFLGRRLCSHEHVHHLNGNCIDNRPENLWVGTLQEHWALHRKAGSNRRLPNEENPTIECACGCGARFERFDSEGRPRKYVSGHNPPPRPAQESVLSLLEHGPLYLGEIRETLPNICVTQTLSVLNKKGLIRRIRPRFWGLSEENIESNPTLECACGCGKTLKKFDKHWRPRRFLSGHNARIGGK